MLLIYLEEFSGLPTGRRIEPVPTEGRIVATNNMGLSSHYIDQFTYTYEYILSDTSPSAATIGYSATAIHEIDIEGVAEERVVEGDDELYIQHYSYHNITCHDHDVMGVY
jgi:hypothetical protein